MSAHHQPLRIGISGTGFVARALLPVLHSDPGFEVRVVLTRRAPELSADGFPHPLLTTSLDRFLADIDIVIECSGDTRHAAVVLDAAGAAGKSLVTLNAEAQVTIGSALLRRGYSITEAHGDQPGALAELHNEAASMGFRSLAFVNIKGFLNPNPSPEDMAYWAKRQSSTVRSVTTYTDGTKMQVEQALIANALGGTVAKAGMLGGENDDLLDLDHIAIAAREAGRPISDYIVNPAAPKGVLVLAESELADLQADYSVFSKIRTRGGQAYMLLRPHYFVHLEILKTLRAVAAGAAPLVTNSLTPSVTVGAVAKRNLSAGTRFSPAAGGFDLRGEAIALDDHPDAAPIMLLDEAILRRPLEAGERVSLSDVDIPETLALGLYLETQARRT